MTRATRIAAAAVLGAFALVAAHVTAQQPDTRDRTIMTFSEAVELPELTLEPGTYVFKLADTPTRNVVQVWSEDEQELLGQWLYVQAERTEVSHETVVMFRETPADAPRAVQYWFYPGERIGKEFIYPREQAERIAARTGQPVMTDNGERVDPNGDIAARDREQPEQQAERAEPQPGQDDRPVGTAGVEPRDDAEPRRDDVAEPRRDDVAEPRRDDAAGIDADVDRRDQAGVQRDTAPVTRDAQPAETQAQAAQPRPARPDTLPQTASPLALSGLIGLLALAGGVAARARRRQ